MENPVDSGPIAQQSPEQTPNNPPQTTVPENSSEFAKKGSLISKKMTLKILGAGCAGVLVVAALFGSASFYQKWRNDPSRQPKVQTHLVCQNKTCTPIPGEGQNECETDANCVPVAVESKPQFAYIKDGTSIWTVDIDGKNKKKLIETTDETISYTALAWKSDTQITYAKCPTSKTNERDTECGIETFDFTNRSITPELPVTNAYSVRKMLFSPDRKYFAYIGIKKEKNQQVDSEQNAILFLRSGSVTNTLQTFLTQKDEGNMQSRILFTKDNAHVLFSTLKKVVTVKDDASTPKKTETITPMVFVYQINGVISDEITNAADPFLFNDEKLGYKKADQLVYRMIGNNQESTITTFANSYNPVLSAENTQIGYWKKEGGFQGIMLGLYDISIGIHRNILRGVVAPVWLTNTSVAGLKAEQCLGQECLLYEFQTNSLVVVDMETGSVNIVDQGKSIGAITPFDQK